MNELKPCPFCGGEAVMETFAVAGEPTPRYRVRCQTEGCFAVTDWDNYSIRDAEERWNRRAEPKCGADMRGDGDETH